MKYDPRAFATGGQTREMFEIVKAGGPVMVPIILCSIVAVAIIIERLWTLRQQRVVPAELDPARVEVSCFHRAVERAYLGYLEKVASATCATGAGEDTEHRVVQRRIDELAV